MNATFVIAPVLPLTLNTPVLAIVTAVEPLNDVPDKPVPIVNAFVVDAATVMSAEPSNATPLMFRDVANNDAVAALPVMFDDKNAIVLKPSDD